MTTTAQESGPSVLIVDRSAESREVLRTVLASRGVRILEAAGASQGLELCRRHHPEVVVLDLDSAAPHDDEMRRAYQSQTAGDDASLVVLGTLRDAAPDQGRYVPKPYHYAPLIRTIEELLKRA